MILRFTDGERHISFSTCFETWNNMAEAGKNCISVSSDDLTAIRKELDFNCYGYSEDLTHRWHDQAFGHQWTDDELTVANTMEENEDLFQDMLFNSEFAAYTTEGGMTWIERPEELEMFNYSQCGIRVEPLGDAAGQYDRKNQVITIDPDCLHEEPVVLHEMIHLHEALLEELPTYYHEICLYALYTSLHGKIDGLDDLIMAHGNILHEDQLDAIGGTHDLLFLLKSYDLDLRKGYKLGTVFGYGYDSD